jgi:hypothetical protein
VGCRADALARRANCHTPGSLWWARVVASWPYVWHASAVWEAHALSSGGAWVMDDRS